MEEPAPSWGSELLASERASLCVEATLSACFSEFEGQFTVSWSAHEARLERRGVAVVVSHARARTEAQRVLDALGSSSAGMFLAGTTRVHAVVRWDYLAPDGAARQGTLTFQNDALRSASRAGTLSGRSLTRAEALAAFERLARAEPGLSAARAEALVTLVRAPPPS